MRLFLYEYITGGGLLDVDLNSAEVPSSLLAEGRAMISALAEDALRIPDAEVTLLWDHRLPVLDLPSSCLAVVSDLQAAAEAFQQQSSAADGTIVIAPESDGILYECVTSVLQAGGKLWGPAPDLVELCTDKQRTAEHLSASKISVPHGVRLQPKEPLPLDFPNSAVLKPVDGCGSQAVQLVTRDSTSQLWSCSHAPDWPVRMEPFIPGEPVSVAVLCGRNQQIALPACKQHLSADGTFSYEGGSLPLDDNLAQRAESLARQAVRSFPKPWGYIGVDLILGSATDGSEDVVIEINPRLTTSYVGLRHATPDNLLVAWAKLIQGEPVSLKFASKPIQFRADGQVTK